MTREEIDAVLNAEMRRAWIRWRNSPEGRALVEFNELLARVDEDARALTYNCRTTLEDFDRERLIAKVWD